MYIAYSDALLESVLGSSLDPLSTRFILHTLRSSHSPAPHTAPSPVAWGHYAGITSERNLTEAKRIAKNAVNIAKGSKSPDLYPAAVLWAVIACEELGSAMVVSWRAAVVQSREAVVRFPQAVQGSSVSFVLRV